MSRRKGLSYEEKRTRLLAYFHETSQVFLLKELEKEASKKKGIVSNTVQEVLMSLVNDDLVCSDKIGTSNYFWAFPSQAEHVLKQKLQKLSDKISESKTSIEIETKSLNMYENERISTDDRTSNLELYKHLVEENKRLTKDLHQYISCDPDLIAAYGNDTKNGIEAVNRWTDNIFCIRKYCQDNFNVEPRDFDKNFGIPEDLDYME